MPALPVPQALPDEIQDQLRSLLQGPHQSTHMPPGKDCTEEEHREWLASMLQVALGIAQSVDMSMMHLPEENEDDSL